MSDTKQYWNIVSTSGNVLNTDAAIYATKEQARVFMDMCYDHCELVPYKPLDLDNLTFNKVDGVIKVEHEGELQFRCEVDNNELFILGNYKYEHIGCFPVDVMSLFPNFNKTQ